MDETEFIKRKTNIMEAYSYRKICEATGNKGVIGDRMAEAYIDALRQIEALEKVVNTLGVEGEPGHENLIWDKTTIQALDELNE